MSEPVFTVPRGMKDIEPSEMARRLWLHDRILEVLRRYGFQVVEPTAIENLETLEAKSGPDIKNEIYWFKDKAGRDLGLRFDLTVGMTRMVANRYDLPEPIKLCALSGMWRYDEPQFARYRHFYQWDAEIYGTIEQEADAEAIAVSMDILENVGLKEYQVLINNRKLIEGFLVEIGVGSPELREETIRVIDKLRKIPRQEMASELSKIGLADDAVNKILEFTSIRGKPSEVIDEVETKRLKDVIAVKGRDELANLAEAIDALGKSGKCFYDLSVVRGIGYYDGIVFEAYDKGGEDIGSIFGGGRYDKLCSIYGKRDVPATGVAGGIERLIISLERASIFPKLSQSPKAFVVAVNDAVRQKTMEIVQFLRNSGVPADFDLKRRTLAKQLEYADSMAIPFAIIVGQREIEKGIVKLRDMMKREEIEVKLEEVPRKISTLGI